jgi:hypothetical protein
MSKHLTLAEIDGQTAVQLPERHLLAVAVTGPGLVNAAVAIDRVEVLKNVNIPVDIDVQNNQICVNVAAINAAAGCQ